MVTITPNSSAVSLIRLGSDFAQVHFGGGNKMYNYDLVTNDEFETVSDVVRYLTGENVSVGRRINALIKSGVFTKVEDNYDYA